MDVSVSQRAGWLVLIWDPAELFGSGASLGCNFSPCFRAYAVLRSI